MKMVILLIVVLWLAFGAGFYFATKGLGPEATKLEIAKTIMAGPMNLIEIMGR